VQPPLPSPARTAGPPTGRDGARERGSECPWGGLRSDGPEPVTDKLAGEAAWRCRIDPSEPASPPRSGARQLAPPLLSLGRMPTPLRAGLVLLVLSSPALAQSISLGFAGGGTNLTSIPFHQSSCHRHDSYTVTWTAANLNSSNACGNLQIFVTNAQSCPNGPPNTSGSDGGTADIVIGTVDINTLATGQGTLTAQRRRDMPGLGGDCPPGL